MKIAIIGSSGFIGSAITKILKTDSDNVVVGFSHQNIDIQDFDTTRKIMYDYEVFDILIYAAISVEHDFINKNINQLQNILNCKDRYKNFVHISSRSVYDGLGCYTDIKCLPLSVLPLPQNKYGKLKYLEEKLINESLSPDKFLICRLFNVYNGLENNAFYTYLQKMIYKNTIMDETVLNMLSINDFAKKFKTLIDRKLEGTFNICSCNKVSFRSFITRFSNYQLLSKISNDYKEFTGKSNLIGCVEQDDFIAEMNKLFRTNPTLFGC